jgi:hypothetical protein
MSKALMMQCTPAGGAYLSGGETAFAGSAGTNATETFTQMSSTEQASFTGMFSRVISGNSGTATFLFRNNNGNGNLTYQIAGAGSNQDTTNTDTVSAGNPFNLGYTDTGTNASVSVTSVNVEFSSGHGNFHASYAPAGVVFDVASSTRFAPLSGVLQADGVATEDNVGFKTRAYDTFPAMAVNVSANARGNTSEFRNRINKADGTGLVSYAAGATGLVTSTGLSDTITDGQVVDVSVTLGTGVEDLTVTMVQATLKSSTTESEMWCGNPNGFSRTASATAGYHPIGGFLTTGLAADTDVRVTPRFAATCGNLRTYISANTYTGNCTLKLMVNGVAQITLTVSAGGTGWQENAIDTFNIDADDEVTLELDEGTANSATIHMCGITFSPVVVGTDNIHILRPTHLDGLGGNRFLGNIVQ